MSQLFLDAGSIKKEVDNCFLDAKPPKLEHAEGTQTPAQMDSKVDLAKPMKREKQRECATNRSPPLSAEHMVRLQQVILDLTVSHTTPNVFPQFEDCAPQSEWLLLVCANRQTADWVRHNFAHMRQKSGLSIELLEDNQVPRNRIDGYFPNSAQLPDDKVLALINAQNPIKTRQWRIIRRAVNGHLLHLSMAIDDDSMHKLGACGGYISYCFGSICLNLNLNRSPMDQAYDSTDQIGSDWNSILTQLENLHVPIGNNSEWHYPFNQAHNAHN
ncbi:uncharacterized protein Dvir_GJ26917 [Drosophila virilis]|uniref:DUF4780 domain-containing protein n=1 Tax=Drosophila virilis TaxID=7244 RepID=A0A0Q9WJ09_DROVI|nr:uncharacterized protein Dvir_GJ26917 [Drosophila virilis]